MEIIALCIVLIVEIGLTIVCIKSKSTKTKTRVTIRLGSAALFVVLFASTIIKWDFRWYAVAAIMLILTVTSFIRTIRNNVSQKVYSRRRTIISSFVMFLLWIVVFSPAMVFPQHHPLVPSGKYSVETSLHTYIDENRIETYSDGLEKRKVTVKFWYPKETNGKFPLIIFSHGTFGVVTSNISLYSELASHGYVVGSVSHTYQSFYTIDADGRTTLLDQGFMREVSVEDARTDKQQSFEFYKRWMDTRMSDINLVLDSVLDRVKDPNHDNVYGLIDTAKIGVMGHSLGGSAALGVGEMREDVGAVLALESPFMYDVVGVENYEFVWNEKPYLVPVLNIYSDSSWSHLSEWPQYAANAKLLTDKSATVINVHINGAGHLSLTDLALTSPFLTRLLNGHASRIDARYCLSTINQLALGFFDYYLKGADVFDPKETY